MPMVAARIIKIPVNAVSTRFSFVAKKTMKAESAISGICNAMETIVTRTTVTTRRSVMASRPNEGASSRRSQSSQFGRCSGTKMSMTALIYLLYDRHGRCTHAEQFGIGILDFDTHREALRDMHPVQFARDGRHA